MTRFNPGQGTQFAPGLQTIAHRVLYFNNLSVFTAAIVIGRHCANPPLFDGKTDYLSRTIKKPPASKMLEVLH
jgi:hypothetical protein